MGAGRTRLSSRAVPRERHRSRRRGDGRRGPAPACSMRHVASGEAPVRRLELRRPLGRPRVFQHLLDPDAALAEMVRVTRPGGRIVVADPDYDTQVVDVPDQELARRVLRFRADTARRGTGRPRIAWAGCSRKRGSPTSSSRPRRSSCATRRLDNAMGLRTWPRSLTSAACCKRRTRRRGAGDRRRRRRRALPLLVQRLPHGAEAP